MISTHDNRDEVRRRLRERLQERGVPSGLGTYAGEDDGAIIRDFGADEIEQLYLLTDDDCPGCQDAMEEFMLDIADGTLKVISSSDDEGIDIVMKLGLTSVPTIVVKLKDGSYLEFKES